MDQITCWDENNLTINVRMVLVKFMRIIWGVYDQYGKPIDIINCYGDYVGMVGSRTNSTTL